MKILLGLVLDEPTLIFLRFNISSSKVYRKFAGGVDTHPQLCYNIITLHL